MTWSQGIQPREECKDHLIGILEDLHETLSGERAQFEYLTWFLPDQSDMIAVFDNGRSIRLGRVQ